MDSYHSMSEALQTVSFFFFLLVVKQCKTGDVLSYFAQKENTSVVTQSE